MCSAAPITNRGGDAGRIWALAIPLLIRSAGEGLRGICSEGCMGIAGDMVRCIGTKGGEGLRCAAIPLLIRCAGEGLRGICSEGCMGIPPGSIRHGVGETLRSIATISA